MKKVGTLNGYRVKNCTEKEFLENGFKNEKTVYLVDTKNYDGERRVYKCDYGVWKWIGMEKN